MARINTIPTFSFRKIIFSFQFIKGCKKKFFKHFYTYVLFWHSPFSNRIIVPFHCKYTTLFRVKRLYQ